MMMKKVLLTLCIAAGLSSSVNAQFSWQAPWVEDTVSMLPSLTQDVYYSMNNGDVRLENNRNYHLAFSMSPIVDSAAIWANHQSGNGFTKVYNIHKPASQFATVSLGDTSAGNLMFNNDKGWFNGAFNGIPSSNIFNFGWGTYDPTSHNVYGDSVFIVRAGGPSGQFFKFIVDSLNGFTTTYYFRIENLSTPAPATSHVISKTPNYTNRLFAYFNMATAVDTNREPLSSAWDILFCRYTTDAPGSGQALNNNVIGLLSNKGIKVAKASMVYADSAYDKYTTYGVDSTISAIGYNWKTFDMANNIYVITDSLSYFITDKSGNIWQLQFINFTGSTGGDFVFRKRPIWPTAVNTVNSSVNKLALVPNPASTQLNLVLDAKESAQAQIMISDLSGKQVFHSQVTVNTGLNAYALPVRDLVNGHYLVSVVGKGWTVSEKVLIAK